MMLASIVLASQVRAHARRHQEARAGNSRPEPAQTTSPALAALYAGNPDRALQIASERLRQSPRDVEALVVAARARLARNEHDAACDLLLRALSVDAHNPDVLYFLGVASSELATSELGRLHKLAPDGPRAHQLLGRSFRLQQRLAEAAAEYELALAADPTLLEALLELAEIRREESNCTEAAALYRRAEDVKATYDGSYGLGVCLAAQGDHRGAIERFRTALRRDPESAVAWFGLGSSLLQLRDDAGAVSALTRAVALQPRMRQAHYLLGRAYAAMGEAERSRQAFARAEELAEAERAADEAVFTGIPPPRVPPRPKRRQ